ncbi:hypothetical protein, partial [Maribacter algarum]|uniref:beta strand repeat-containing protein n=1 Tax=Maribacter algarum (ex Zhang et al. 2020) TaxID=2578118 RepID=UPI001BB24A04
TYTDESGATQTIDTNASSNPYDNTTSGLTATDVQAAIDEINAAAGTVALTDNLDGTYTFTDAAGGTVLITDTSLSTMSAPVNGVYTYTDESGATQTIDTNASSNPYDNTTSGLTATDVQAAIDEINAAAGTVALTDNLDGTYTFTDAAGGTVLITDTSLSTMSAPVNGVYTYTDEAGNVQTIDSNDPDAVVGNEVVNGTDATLTRSGTGTNADPYTLDVSADGITNAEIADDAVQLENIANGTTTGQVIQWDGTDWVLIDLGSVTVTEIDGVIGNEVVNGTDATLTRSGTGTNADPYTLDVAADGITNAEISDNAVQLENIADGSAIGQIMQWNGTDWTLVDGGGLSTDDQNIESLGVDTTTNVLTVGIEDGTSQTVDLSHLDDAGTDDQDATEVNLNAAVDVDGDGNNETTVQEAIEDLAAGSTDDQNIESLGVDTTTNVLTVGIEDGTSQTVDLSHLDDAGTDDQIASEVNITDAGGNFTATEVEGALAELAAGSTDDQNIENLALNGATNELTVGIEDGTSQTVDLSGLVGTDDQDATEVNLNTAVDVDGDGNNETTVQEAIEDLAANSTDDQNISTDGSAGNISIEDGNTITLNVNDADAVIGNEYNTGSAITAGSLEITDGGGTESVNLISGDANNDITAGTDGALYLNVASVTISETNTTLGFNGATNELTYTNELGNNPVLDLSSLVGTDDQTATEVTYDNTTSGLTATDTQAAIDELSAGSTDNQNIESLGVDTTTNVLTVGIEDGTSQTVDLSHLDDAGTDDQIASEVNITDAGGNFTATEVEGALAELAASSTDNQNIENLALNGATNELTVGIEDGTSQTVDLSGLVGTDNQNIESLGVNATTNILTVGIEDGTGQTVDLSHLDDAGTDNQNIESLGVDATSNILTVGIEDGTSQTVDLSHLDDAGTDNQNIESLGVDATSNILTVGIEDGTSQTVDLSHLDDAGTDNQNIESLGVDATSNILTVGIEDGTSQTVDLSHLDDAGTDNQNIESLGLSGANVLTVGIEDGSSQTVDLSGLVGTDDQTAVEVSIADAGGNFTSTDVEGALTELAAGSTDNQNIENLGVSTTTNVLTVGIEDGTSQTVDLSHLDDAGTDNQNIESLAVNATTNVLTVGIEDGTSQTVDLSHLDDAGTDDQTAAEVSIADAGGNFTSTDVEGALTELAAGSTDNQNIENLGLSGANILTVGIEDGSSQTVDLSGLVGTDNQNIESLAVNTTSNVLTVGIEDGTSQTVDLSHLDDAGTDSQTLSTDGTAGDITISGGNNITLNVDDADSIIGNEVVNATDATLTRSGAGTTLSPYTLDVAADGITNAEIADDAVQLENIADGTSDGQVMQWDGTSSSWTLVDLGSVTVTENDGVIGNEVVNATDGTLVRSGAGTTVSPYTLDVAADGITNAEIADNAVQLENIADGTSADQIMQWNGANWVLVDGAGLSTDNQNIESLAVNTTSNVLTVGIEDGTSQTVDLSHLDDAGTDNQNIESLAVNTTSNVLTVGIEDGTSQTVDLSHLDDAGTDNQNIESLGLSGANVLTVGIEDGSSQTVNLSSLVGTDDQTASEVSIADAGGNFTSTDVEGALTELAAGSTDNQNIESLAVNTTSNVLTVGIEDGTSQTVDLSHLDDAGTDNQNIESLGLSGANVLTVGIEDGSSQTVDLSGLVGTDNQNIESLAVNTTSNVLTVGIEDGTSQTVDLSHLDDAGTDNQNIESLAVNTTSNVLTVGIEDGTSQTVDLSHLDDAGTDDQTAAEVSIADAGGNFTSTDVEGALTELAAGSTDNQNIESLGVNTTSNVLTVGIEDGTSQTVDLSHLDDAGTDNQNIESLAVNTTSNVLTVGIEDGTSQTVDLSHLDDAGTDDQTASEVSIADAGGNFTSTDVEGALTELAAGSTDNQNIESLAVNTTSNVLTVGIEDGASQTVDLSHLDDAGTDNQNIESLGLSGANVLTVGIEDGSSQTVNLSSLVGTDDQTASEVSIADAGGNFTSTDVEGALTELAAGSTDNQNIESLAVNTTTNVLTVGIEDGSSDTVDLSHLDNPGTDNQNIENLGLAGTTLTVGIEDGTAQTVNLSSLVGTDNQNIESLAVNTTTNILTVGIEDGSSDTVDLSHLDNPGTDNQNIESLAVNTTTNVLTVGIEDGTSQTVNLSHLDNSGTDNQNIESLGLSGANVLTVGIEDGSSQTVNLSSLVGTDNQNIESLAVNTTTNVLTVGIEDGSSDTVDLSHLDDSGTDNQNIENLGLAGTTLTVGIEDGTAQTVNLSSLVGTDNQNIESLAVNTTTNVLTVGIEDGSSDTVDLSHLDNPGTDNQNIENLGLAGTTLTVGIEDGTAQTVNLSSLVGTDNQNIESLAVNTTTNVLTVGIEDGSSDTVDLSHLDNPGTDNQNIESLAVNTTSNVLTVGIEDGTSQTVNLSHLDDSGTDNQNIESLGLSGTTLTVGIEDGSSQTVDLAGLSDHDWYEVGGTSAPNAIGDNIFTQGTVAIGRATVTAGRTLDVEGDIELNERVYMNGDEAFQSLTSNNWLRINPSNDFSSGTRVDGHFRADDRMTVNESGNNNDMRVEGQNDINLLFTDASTDQVGIGLNSPEAKLDVNGNARVRTLPAAADTDQLVSADVDGNLRKVNSLKASKVFYPPSITVDASTTGIKNIDLYDEYLTQFSMPTVGSTGAPLAVPFYGPTDLYYYVTYADPTVFETDIGDPNFPTIDADGNLTIEVENIPTDYNTLINVVFVVK